MNTMKRDLTKPPRLENILILDYNTIKLQSMGFIELVKQNGLESAKLHSLNSVEKLQIILNNANRNTSELFNESVSESDYIKFLKRNYINISEAAPYTKLFQISAVTSTQQFVSSIYLASYVPYSLELSMTHRMKQVTFDIFNVIEVEKFILENKITSVFTDDIRMVYDLVFNFKIPIADMRFIISKIGYNFISKDTVLTSAYPELNEVAETLNFKIAFIDIYDTSIKEELK